MKGILVTPTRVSIIAETLCNAKFENVCKRFLIVSAKPVLEEARPPDSRDFLLGTSLCEVLLVEYETHFVLVCEIGWLDSAQRPCTILG